MLSNRWLNVTAERGLSSHDERRVREAVDLTRERGVGVGVGYKVKQLLP